MLHFFVIHMDNVVYPFFLGGAYVKPHFWLVSQIYLLVFFIIGCHFELYKQRYFVVANNKLNVDTQ